MTPYRRFSTLPQLALSLAVFTAAALLLESGGLYDWAARLDLGPERTVALPLATGLHHALAPLRLERTRQALLVASARIGWSDDPVALAEAAGTLKPPTEQPATTPSPNPTIPATTTPANAAPGAPHTNAASLPPALPLEGAPPLSTPLPAIPAVEPGKTRTVALAGDSMMAVGLSSTLLRQAPRFKHLTFLKTFKSGTGLARPEVFNWQLEYPAMLKDAKPDIVLVAIGANDGQGFVEDGVTYPFGTDGWTRIYQRRVQAYLTLLQSTGATVVWLGLPPMKADSYDAHIALINRIDYAIVSASPHAIWFSTAGLVGDANGRFRDFGDVAGHTTRLRQPDGIHLSDDGATLVATRLLPWLAEQKPAEQKPAEQKPAEQKPAEQKPAEQKPAEQKPAATPPAIHP